MDIINSFSEKKIEKKSVVVIGNFDGIHLGHQTLIQRAIDEGRKNDIQSVVYTFNRNTHSDKSMIYPNRVKISIMNKMGIDCVYIQRFEKSFSLMSPQEFIENILIKNLNPDKIIVGFNFRFGKDAAGEVNYLQETLAKHGVELIVINKVTTDEKVISSTLVRNYIKQGNLEQIEKCLGRKFAYTGEVVHGRKIGRKIGFPTANVKVEKFLVTLPTGVYATKTRVENECFYGLTNIGNNPTFGLDKVSVENHILGFDRDIYGKQISVNFLKKLREEIKFNNIGELINQMNQDKKDLQKLITMVQ